MKEPVWITRLMADAIHADLMQQHGGLRGLRDENALESLLARPRNKWAHDTDCDVPSLAAAYAYGLARSHPFTDGNKRTAFMLMYVFLELNGLEFDAPEADVVRQMLLLAEHRLPEEALVNWIRAASKKRRG